MSIRHLLGKIGIITVVAVISVALVGGCAWAGGDDETSSDTTTSDDKPDVQVAPETDYQCATILSGYCSNAETDGQQVIMDVIKDTIGILTVGIGVLATIGIIICGYLILTARDNEQQIAKAKKRLFEIIIGIVLWALGAAGVLLLIPDEEAANVIESGGVVNMEIKE